MAFGVKPRLPNFGTKPTGGVQTTEGAAGADLLGEGTIGAAAAPTRTPEQIAADQAGRAQQQVRQTAQQTAQQNIPYQQQRQTESEEFLGSWLNNPDNPIHSSGIDLPYLGDIPYIGETIEGGFEGIQGGGLAFAEEAVDDPLTFLATGGMSGAIAAGDTFADSVATGVAQDISGDPMTQVDVPLTPGQLWGGTQDPLYQGRDEGSTVNFGGLKSVPGAIGDALGGLGGGGGGSGGGGAGVPGAGGDQMSYLKNTAGEFLEGDILPQVDPSLPYDKGRQMTELDRIRQFGERPQRQEDIIGQLQGFMQQPQGPSVAEQQMLRGRDQAMSDALSLARSGRGGAGAQARALRGAMAENAATQAGSARDLGLLRAQEQDMQQQRQLQALGQMGGLAGGIDQNVLQSLGLASGAARDIRGQGIQERGQDVTQRTGDLSFLEGLIGQTTDLTGRQMQADATRYAADQGLGFEEQLALAGVGGLGDLLSLLV